MLQIMRDISKSWAAKTLMALLIVSFGIWGIGDMFRGNLMQRAVATVGDISISVQALERDFEREMPNARRILGEDLTIAKARAQGVLDRTLSIMIDNTLFDQEAKRLGLNVGDDIILARLATQPQLRDKDGKFNTQLWQHVLAQNGISERGFIDSERSLAARRMILDTVVNQIELPKTIADALYVVRGAKRIFQVVTLDNASVTDIKAPEESTLQEYYQSHNDEFMAPEYRALTVAVLSSDAIPKDIAVSDDETRKAYADRTADLTRPEKRDFIQVILQDETKAKALAESAQTGQNLVLAAKSMGYSAVDLKDVDERSVLPALYTTLFSLEPNQVSPAIKSDLGWHVAQLKNVMPAGVPAFEEVKDQLRKTLQNEKAGDILAKTVNQLDDDLASGKQLEDIADSLKLRLIKIPSLDAQGKLPDGKEPAELPGKEVVLKTAFALNQSETSQVIDDNSGNYIVVRADEVVSAHVEPFETIKNKVVAAVVREAKAEKAKQMAQDIANAIRNGENASTLAARKGVSVRFSKPISLLGDVDRDLPLSAITVMLKMKKGEVVALPAKDKQLILKLTEIIPVDPAKPDAAYARVLQSLKEKMPYEPLEEYSNLLRTRFPVKINQDLLGTMKSMGSQ